MRKTARQQDIQIWYGARAMSLVANDGAVRGVKVRRGDKEEEIACEAVILASGGFQANAAWRTRYLGPGWDLAKVRGSRFSVGDGIRMALEIGAMSAGNWSGCHAVGWERNAPEFGDLAVGDAFQKHSYPFGVMLNANGRRFVDEGADFRNYTYAKYGRVILEQPGQFAWQLFDSKVLHLLRDELRPRLLHAIQGHGDVVEHEILGELQDIGRQLARGLSRRPGCELLRRRQIMRGGHRRLAPRAFGGGRPVVSAGGGAI